VVLKPEGVGKLSEADIHAFMKSRVAKHKMLVGGIKFIDEVPKLASGKIVRKLMKEWAKRDAVEMQGKPRARL
jgi:4-coumarate--CoA ligase